MPICGIRATKEIDLNMLARRTVAILTVGLICLLPQIGCNQQRDGVDAPLMKPGTAPKPPPPPNKPVISPKGAG